MTVKRGYLIDTNVISELIRENPNPGVVRWLVAQSPDTLYISAITLGELVHGVARLPESARRDRLREWLEVDVRNQFAGRLLEFGESQAVAWGHLKAETEQRGRPSGAIDLQLAATAQVSGLALVTRNVRDFEDLGLSVIDPWVA